MKKKNFLVHTFRTDTFNMVDRLPTTVEFYVRTEKGINRGTVHVSETGTIMVTFFSNQWLVKPYVKFITEKKKNNVSVILKGCSEKDDMLVFTINAGRKDFKIKTN